MDADVIVVGAGHNGLVCAAYLARSGARTILVESRSAVGGCASTVEVLGARFNICSCDHTMVRATPIIDELDLGAHGLRYLEATPPYVNLFWSGQEPWLVFHDVERTVDDLRATRPGSAGSYAEFFAEARPVAELLIELSGVSPTAPAVLSRVLERRARGAGRLLRWSRMSIAEVLAGFFDDPSMSMPAISTGPTVWGVAPDMPGTGLAAASFAIRHLVPTGRPEGGSGALTEALRRAFERSGGDVRCGARVDRLVLTGDAVAGVRLADETEITARRIVAACDPRRVFVEWIGEPPHGPRRVRRAVDRWRGGWPSGYESKVDAVIAGRPSYPALAAAAERHPDLDLAQATAVISPSPSGLAEAHRRQGRGEVAASPTMLMNVPSVLDPTMRTASGDDVLSLEVLFTPYELAGGWAGSNEPRRWLERWAELVEPGFLDSVSAWRAMTPDRYEAEFDMRRGHSPAYRGSPLATLIGRRRELSRYRTPVDGLYLTGAGTYPGAGIWGAPGRNAAAVVEASL